MYKDVEYHPLMASDPSDTGESVSPPAKPARPSRLSRTVLVIVCAVETIALVAAILLFVHRTPTTADQCTLYSNSPTDKVLYCERIHIIKHSRGYRAPTLQRQLRKLWNTRFGCFLGGLLHSIFRRRQNLTKCGTISTKVPNAFSTRTSDAFESIT